MAKTKPRIIKTDTEYIYIPGASRERFLTPPFPSIKYLATNNIMMAGLSTWTDGYRIDRYKIYHHLLLYTLGGAGSLKINDGKTVKLKKGDLFIAPYDSNYSYWTDSHWDAAWLHLSADSKWDTLFGTTAHVRKSAWGKEMDRVMQGYIEESDRRRVDSGAALHSYVDLILLYIQREIGGDDPLLADARRTLEGLWSTVQQDLKKTWSVDSLAQFAGMSRSCFHRTVVDLTGSSPMQVINTMRMERAGEMLLYTNYTLSMIAEEIGYETQFSFSKAFKRYSGKSPKEFREEMSK
ncbi:RCS-specific HTH-type transcriptional activator RclR [Pontiella desulfatans]|uniref:RCS-specific HTH-type transcriptional activator RclR n=1 Tax=Pontiella desulfatans TaxID=2750659 RepID=A0A6C2TZP3_PONDE|nr:AraC family transcriptional regulator [Pontiella desulfatans]VGO13075.1 RCS-specific HTH-type transcriptional activator RclR [Pontiella desulfatans]